jgi:hypothetical protein
MKRFKNLIEVLAYHSICPLCSAKMSVDRNFNYDENANKAYLKFGATHLTVDCFNNNIIKCDQVMFSGSPIMYSNSSFSDLSGKGVDLRGLKVSCDFCLKYSYLVQVHISLEHNKIVDLVLNSESISIEENTKLYEVKNIYTTEKTEMAIFHTHLSNKRGALDKVELPLVPLDFENPMKTVERIKSLLVFL